MDIKIVDNKSILMSTTLLSALDNSSDIRIAVAFVSKGGYSIIYSGIEEALKRGAKVEFLVGLDMYVTEPDAIRTLFERSVANSSFSMYCLSKLDPFSIYHPKLYLCKSDASVTAIIGSSNLTEGGLCRNVEINASIQIDASNEIASDLYSSYNKLKFHHKRVIPDSEFITLYSELFYMRKSHEKTGRRNPIARSILRNFDEKAASLQHPKPDKDDLVGWLEMVYNALPNTEFTNRDIYRFENDFKIRYPHNANIRAKIRQQLQELRDLELIEHIGSAQWRKRS
jgi:HKD family nuclease